MTEYATGGSVPQWDLGDRMRKALKHAGISVEQIADYLGVTRGFAAACLAVHLAWPWSPWQRPG